MDFLVLIQVLVLHGSMNRQENIWGGGQEGYNFSHLSNIFFLVGYIRLMPLIKIIAVYFPLFYYCLMSSAGGNLTFPLILKNFADFSSASFTWYSKRR